MMTAPGEVTMRQERRKIEEKRKIHFQSKVPAHQRKKTSPSLIV
jgi:hypothetical protein